MEKFIKKKLEEKNKAPSQPCTGDTSETGRRLVLDMSKNDLNLENVSGSPSPCYMHEWEMHVSETPKAK